VLILLTACSGGADRLRIQQDEFSRVLQEGAVTVIDVRSYSAYLQGHIPGALFVPLEHVEQRAQEIKALGKPIVTYCSCPAEETSLAAVATLKRVGVKGARALTGGYQSWVGAGNRTVRGERPL
jgi:rhodanese-related sulfurtransferase